MTYVPDAAAIERKLRAAQMAAASALVNGATVDQVREAVERGIGEAQALLARSSERHAA